MKEVRGKNSKKECLTIKIAFGIYTINPDKEVRLNESDNNEGFFRRVAQGNEDPGSERGDHSEDPH